VVGIELIQEAMAVVDPSGIHKQATSDLSSYFFIIAITCVINQDITRERKKIKV
jgi:hypothetical protein